MDEEQKAMFVKLATTSNDMVNDLSAVLLEWTTKAEAGSQEEMAITYTSIVVAALALKEILTGSLEQRELDFATTCAHILAEKHKAGETMTPAFTDAEGKPRWH